MEGFEFLPPMTLFDVPDTGLLLADGFHRHGAVTRLVARGDLDPEAIRVELRQGTREDALEFAVIANAAHKENLTDEERNDGIRRLRQLHPKMGERELGRMMGVSEGRVHRLSVVDRVRQYVLWKPATRIADAIVYEVGCAQQAHWEPLLRAADKQTWTRDDVRRARELLYDDEVPREYRQALLAGEVDPLPPGMKAPAPLIQVAFDGGEAGPEASAADGVQGERWQDPVGPDVAERYRTVRVTLSIDYSLPSDEERTRGVRRYRRESEDVSWRIEATVNHRALEGLGDPRSPRAESGLAYLLQEVMRQAWRRAAPSWPQPAELYEEVR
jgi:hypothetical protein